METKTCFIFITDNNEIVATKNLIGVRAEAWRVVLYEEKENFINKTEIGSYKTTKEAKKMIDHIAESLLFAQLLMDGFLTEGHKYSSYSCLVPAESITKNPSNLDFIVIDCRLKKIKKK